MFKKGLAEKLRECATGEQFTAVIDAIASTVDEKALDDVLAKLDEETGAVLKRLFNGNAEITFSQWGNGP